MSLYTVVVSILIIGGLILYGEHVFFLKKHLIPKLVLILVTGVFLRLGYRMFYLKKQLDREDIISLFTLVWLYILSLLKTIQES